jgi:trans-2,3-dihydro-3-hydroxyanthranilate isomerase
LKRWEYRLVDVFTNVQFGGNPLAVFPQADGLDPDTMQHIANELNLAESTFISKSDRPDCDARLRISTPRAELAMAGHPTIGSAWVIARGDSVVFEEGIGPVRVRRASLSSGDPGWWMTQSTPSYSPCIDASEAVVRAVGLGIEDLAALPVEVGSAGTPVLYVPVASLDALRRASLGGDRWARLRSSSQALLAYVFFCERGSSVVRARMFAPALGIVEDPATGGAGGPLGFYLLRHDIVACAADGRALIRCEQARLVRAWPQAILLVRPETQRRGSAEAGYGAQEL